MGSYRNQNDAGKLFLGIFFFAFIFILIATLFPFTFHLIEFPKSSISRFQFVWFRGLNDFLENILLFVPLGFGLGGITHRRKINYLSQLAFVLIAGLCLSIIVEVLQIFLLSRFPSSSDVFANLIGTGLGLIVFKNFKQKFVNCVFYILGRLKSFLVPKTLIGFLLIYIFFAFYLTNELAKSITLDNWDETYHLLVGNEKTGDRPWRGNVYNIKILNKAISENEIKKISHQASSIKSRDNTLVCLYELDQRKYFYDQTGLNPDLSWKNKAQNRERKNYKSISGDHWLETEYPVAKMINKIKGSSQFTLVTTVASDDTFQSGPARIVSISKDPYNQNMMLGQEGSDLVFRLRTPLTKRNGMSPELIAQNIFSDRKPHNIIITYNGRSILLFVDGKKKAPSLELSPGAVLWNYFFLTKAYDLFGYRWLYHVIISVPVFFLVWGLVKSKKAR